MYIFFLVFILILLCCVYFLSSELIKKFRFWKNFQENYPHQISWEYHGDLIPWMYTLKLSGNRDFQGLIWFDFSVESWSYRGYDIFGYIKSSTKDECTISLYLWSWPVTLIFLLDTEAKVSIEHIEESHNTPDFIFLPHWWQKLGFFG